MFPELRISFFIPKGLPNQILYSKIRGRTGNKQWFKKKKIQGSTPDYSGNLRFIYLIRKHVNTE